MGKLVFTESGKFSENFSEDLSRDRRVKKVLSISDSDRNCSEAVIYIMAGNNPDTEIPLHINLNGKELEPLYPAATAGMRWFRVDVDTADLRSGSNEIILWTEAYAQNTWSLGLEGGHTDPHSYLSFDSGLSWQNQYMGFSNSLSGEYLIRLLLDNGYSDREIPSFSWEDSSSPMVGELKALIPREVKNIDDFHEKLRAMTSWISRIWPHTDSGKGNIYTPWDPWTIIAWNTSGIGHKRGKPIGMCVHYSVLFTSLCTASGIHSRNVVVTESMNSSNGHFLAEVWDPKVNKWLLVDPNQDLFFIRDGEYLSISEVADAGTDLSSLVVEGPGTAAQREYLENWVDEVVKTGLCFKMWGIWNRNDYISHPEQTGFGHGQHCYSETDIVWYRGCENHEDIGMFPYLADVGFFHRGPENQLN